AVGIIEITSGGRIIYANATALSFFNISDESLLGSNFAELFAGDERQRVLKLLRETGEHSKTITSDSPLNLMEHRVKLKILSINSDGSTSIIILNDVTEQERVEKMMRLRDLELRLYNQASQALNSSLNLDQVLVTVLEEVRRLMGIVGSSIWLTDPETDELVCKQATGAYGETLLGWRLATGEGLAGWVASHGESLISSDTYADERHHKEVDLLIGRDMHSVLTVPLRIKGDVIGVVQVVDTEAGLFDESHLTLLETLAGSAAIAIENARLYEKGQKEIATRKKTEEALRESENRYRTVLEANPDSVIVYDMEGRVTYLNPTFTKVFGWKLEDRLGKKMDMFVPEEDWPTTRIMIEKVLSGEDVSGIETQRYTKAGDIIPVSISGAIYNDRDGNPAGSVVNLRDISEQKKLEAQIRQSQKMEAIGTLAGGIAHDYNNLLMGILGNVSLISFDFDSSHPYYSKLKNIEKYVQSGADLTKQLLGFAKGGKYEIKLIDINVLVEKSSEMFSRTKKEIRIHRKYQEDIWSIEVDPSQIEQVLLNLYVNAGQAMPGGGDLYLQTENVTLNENYVSKFSAEIGDYVMISVKDTGVGMDENTIKRIFDPFFTTKDRERGTGLGLASAYGIIKNHDGIINANSIIGKGTTFDVYLPASKKKVVQKTHLDREALRGSETILLIDDEDIIIEIGGQILERLGYRVLMARSGKEAIEIYRANKSKINMVILDMIMPDMGGGETYDRLKKINPEIQVLLSSGYSINGQASEIMNCGCNGFIPKPFNVEQLSRKIREILGKE
ncbi:MAG: PAS domain S-box protein, partial [Deltaproteobacteria bacterium]|nr:PAS domain S-box protein [Deltaproteobacteria bacterium]